MANRSKYDGKYYYFIRKFNLEDCKQSRSMFKQAYREGSRTYIRGFERVLGNNDTFKLIVSNIWKEENNVDNKERYYRR